MEKVLQVHKRTETDNDGRSVIHCLRLLVAHCLQITHLMQQKATLIVTKAKTV